MSGFNLRRISDSTVNSRATAAIGESFLELPEFLRAAGFRLRPESEGDFEFLERLYISVRWPELEPTAWPDDAKIDFLRSQFLVQRRQYQTQYGDARFVVVEKGTVAAGRFCLLRGPQDFRIVDISLLPEFRGQGIGTALLEAVIREAARQHASVSLHVEKYNRAQRLYRRLGFVEAGENGPYWLMVRPFPESL
jgi:ribosomal protein S18 acetylase RimI-like enzyme